MIHPQYAIIFDCDGTLTDSLDHALTSFHYAVRRMDAHHITTEDIHQYFGIAADKILFQLMDLDAVKAQEAFEHFLDNQRLLAKDTRLFDGIPELLSTLKKRQIPLGLVTGRHSRDLNIMLNAHQLQTNFSIMVTDDQVSAPKPNPEGILKAAAHLGIPPQNTLYIGDSPVDVEAAHRAGATSVAVVWDPHANQIALAEKHPHFTINEPSDILRIFDQFIAK